MECLLGIACKDFVMFAADASKLQSILVMKDDDDKILQISSKILMATCGESGDRTMFSEFIAKNVQLYKMRNGYELSPSAAATFTRRKMAEYLRSQTPYQVNMLMGGYDEKTDKFELFYLDYLGALVKVPFAVHGYGGYFSTSIMDRYHKDDLTIEEGIELMKRCVVEVQKRLVINLSNFKIKVVARDGVHILDDITAKNIAIAENQRGF